MTKAQKTIAVDIDDVLAKYAEGFVTFSNERWGLDILPEHYTEDWATLWRVPYEVALERVKEVYSSGLYRELQHFKDAVPVLEHLHSRYNLIIATSRRTVVRGETLRWLDEHFPGLFADIHFVGIWDASHVHNVQRKLQQTKAELCREIGADYLIDDQPKHCIAAADAGIESVLFGDYGWNRDVSELPQGVFRAKDWQAVDGFFNAKD